MKVVWQQEKILRNLKRKIKFLLQVSRGWVYLFFSSWSLYIYLLFIVVDRIPIAELKTLIESLATRTNYGLDVSDLPSALPKGVTEIPAVGLSLYLSRNVLLIDSQYRCRVYKFGDGRFTILIYYQLN